MFPDAQYTTTVHEILVPSLDMGHLHDPLLSHSLPMNIMQPPCGRQYFIYKSRVEFYDKFKFPCLISEVLNTGAKFIYLSGFAPNCGQLNWGIGPNP